MSEILVDSNLNGGTQEIYTTGETQIDTFLGKPLFRRVYKVDVSLPQNSNTQYVLGDFNLTTGYMTKSYAIVVGGTWFSSPVAYSSNSNGTVFINNFFGASGASAKAVVLEYTKETW